METLKSMFMKLNINDILKAALMLVIMTIVSSLSTIFSSGAFPTSVELLASLKLGILAGLSYLCKNLLTNSKGEFMKKEPTS